MSNRVITAVLVTAAVLFAATAEAKHGKMMRVQLMKTQEVTMADGTKTTAYVVEMNGGGTVVAIPADKISADLHKQLF